MYKMCADRGRGWPKIVILVRGRPQMTSRQKGEGVSMFGNDITMPCYYKFVMFGVGCVQNCPKFHDINYGQPFSESHSLTRGVQLNQPSLE